MRRLAASLLVALGAAYGAAGGEGAAFGPNPWQGKKVAFLGDSITDARHIGTRRNYWQFLPEYLGIESHVYGINGQTWGGVLAQARKLKAEMGDTVDAILVFAGTNDYNGGTPLGDWWTTREEAVVRDGATNVVARRVANFDPRTFRGRINAAMAYLKHEFPRQQIVLLTPIHRAFASFGPTNVQPDESYPNRLGLYVDAYVDVVKEAGGVWSAPVIDLYADSGLYPCDPVYARYFSRKDTDMLHPNAAGHDRMARTIARRLLALPSDFKEPDHVVARIADAGQYEHLNPRFAKAFAFLRRPDLATLPEGRYEIDGTNCWAMIQNPALKPWPQTTAEAHRRYIDIQAPISGPETFGIGMVRADWAQLPFDEEKDYMLFEQELPAVTLQPGEFALFFPPHGAHIPCCAKDGAKTVRKLVIKVLAK